MKIFTLAKPVEDINGRIHRAGELVRIVHRQARAQFDSRMLFTVAFEDDSTAVVFAEEIMQSIDTGTESALPFS